MFCDADLILLSASIASGSLASSLIVDAVNNCTELPNKEFQKFQSDIFLLF